MRYVFLGVPFNIASYSLLIHILAKECSLDVGEFIHTLGDYHIYHQHFKAINIQLSRETKKLPTLVFDKKIFLSILLMTLFLQITILILQLKLK